MFTDTPPITISAAVEIADIIKTGTIDYAVPLSWREANPKEKAVWIYTAKSRIWGRPLRYLTILRLARRKATDQWDQIQIAKAIENYI